MPSVKPSNFAAFLTGSKVHPLEVRSAPYTSPSAHQIVVKNAVVAVNPVDWIKQDIGEFLYGWIKYPFVLGYDVAGEVVEAGSAVTRFKAGDRVVGLSVGMEEKINTSVQSGFQNYTVLLDHMVAPIPDAISYENAVVIPLGLSTAASGLFQKDQLALELPTVPARAPSSIGKTLIVWGGATSVGCNAIQLAVAAGYQVVTTASPKNFDLVKKLGASQAFDYRSKTVVSDMIAALQGQTIAGALTMGPGAAEACRDIVHRCKGDKVISMATYPSLQPPPQSLVLPRTVLYFVSWMVRHTITTKLRGIRSQFIWGGTVIFNEVGPAMFKDFLPKALAEAAYVPAPEPQVVGEGLESIQAAFDRQKKGVSATKLVVTL
ncbi:MAG: hypothetical protein M1838_005236 [Thelocarpon superellum]|nr:MAG: hypothetical protein M1838_005236 [Thelocarpon superellum]